MAFFDVDIDNVVWTNLPVRLRQVIQFAWLKAVIAPVKYIYGLFMANRVNNLYYLAHNSQVCYMEAALNDTFDNTLRRIYITDGADEYPIYEALISETEYIYEGLASEVGGLYANVLYEPLAAETVIEEGTGFVVHVPAAILNVAYMTAQIDAYRLPGRNNYAIITF
jgi:hypothetical protein